MNITLEAFELTNAIENFSGELITRNECKEMCMSEQLVYYNSELIIIPTILAISTLASYILLRHNESLKIKDEDAIKYLNFILSFNLLLIIGFIIQFIFFIPK